MENKSQNSPSSEARKIHPEYERLLADFPTAAIALCLYFFALAPMILGVWALPGRSPLLYLVFVLVLWRVSVLLFVLASVALTRLLTRKLPAGRYSLDDPRLLRWILMLRIVRIVRRSVFYPTIADSLILRYVYLWGMGADISPSLILGAGVLIPEPGALKVGKGVLIGDGATISGHDVNVGWVDLDSVEIGDRVLIGARAMVNPGVRIGTGAVVGANSVLEPGTVIHAGETWVGNPARKVDNVA